MFFVVVVVLFFYLESPLKHECIMSIKWSFTIYTNIILLLQLILRLVHMIYLVVVYMITVNIFWQVNPIYIYFFFGLLFLLIILLPKDFQMLCSSWSVCRFSKTWQLVKIISAIIMSVCNSWVYLNVFIQQLRIFTENKWFWEAYSCDIKHRPFMKTR